MHIAIIGNGISGITAARTIRKLSDHKVTVISSETDYFYSRTALMYIYMGHMRAEDTKPYEDWFWTKNRIDLRKGHVASVDFNQRILHFEDNSTLPYDKLIFAVGSKPNKFGWPGQDLDGVGGLYHMQDLQRMERYSKDLQRAVIVGGGLIGLEMAEMFHSRHIPVTMLVREDLYWRSALPEQESKMITDHIKKHDIDLRLGVNLGHIHDNGNGAASGVTIKETQEKLDCGFVGLTAGVSPNIAWLKDSELDTQRGILVDEHLQTNVEDVFAIGDCAQLLNPIEGRRSIEAVWYTGRMMGETVAHTICNSPTTYDPGLWFNSAKFIDIEYQVYGDIPSQPNEGIKSLYWEHVSHEKSVRINYDESSGAVTGFNLMGIRYRHQVCEKWIMTNTHIEEVLKNLGMANFDPEFFKQYEQEIVDLYNKESGSNLKLQTKRGLKAVLAFLQK